MLSDLMDAKMQELLDESYKIHQKNIEKLSREQFKEVIAQIIASGDIQLHVMQEPQSAIHRQAFTYIPYRDAWRSKNRTDELEIENNTLREHLYEVHHCNCENLPISTGDTKNVDEG